MPRLVFAPGLRRKIHAIVTRIPLETGVRLFGVVSDSDYRVLHVVGPGPRAVHTATAYECDNDYAEAVYARLLVREPELRFLGELHAHPDGSSRLSATDLNTVREVLRELPFFIAGVIQRRPFRMYPVLFESADGIQGGGEVCSTAEIPGSERSWAKRACRLSVAEA